MKHCVLYAWLAMIVTSAGALAQGDGAIRGQVLMPDGNTPSRELQIVLYDAPGLRQQDVAFTDSNGRFIFVNVGDGEYRIVIKSEGGDAFETTQQMIRVDVGNRYFVISLRPKRGEPAPAVATLDARIPEEARAAYERGVQYLQREDAGKARKELEKAVAAYPDFFEAQNDLGMVLVAQEQFAEAEQHLRKAVELKNEDYRSRYNLGVALIRQNKFSDARPLLESVVREQANLPSAHYYLGVVLYAYEEYPAAEQHLVKAYDLDPGQEVEALMVLGNVYYLQGKISEAISSFERFLAAAPRAPNRAEVEKVIADLKKQLP